MSPAKKLSLGVATFWPLIYVPAFILLMVLWAAGVAWAAADPKSGPGVDSPLFVTFGVGAMIGHLLTAADTVVVLIYYIFHMMTNERLSEQRKITWAILMITTSALAAPAYFVVEIWREPAPARDGPGLRMPR